MKFSIEVALLALLLCVLLTMDQFLGRRVMLFAAGLATTWFFIALVLLTRPPGIPELVSEEAGEDEQFVIRKDVIPKVPASQRIRLALSVACGSCILLWVTLELLAN